GTAAAAQSKEAFTPERFEELRAQDALILIDVFADWCPVCAMQQEVLVAFREEHPDVPLRILTVDFDTQKEWVRHFGAPRQSTLILYRGQERLWFSVAETRADRIVCELLRAAEPHAAEDS
ncbi:MAG TPA: thioredoxin family protein, partial [Longimicrobiaceae bacterium]|nr:thioredoxin family protein [Longimicrobiaceae bacterium]